MEAAATSAHARHVCLSTQFNTLTTNLSGDSIQETYIALQKALIR
jgi:hypothetical protein